MFDKDFKINTECQFLLNLTDQALEDCKSEELKQSQ